MTEYRGFKITREPPPVPCKLHWVWWHPDVDSAEDYYDTRQGRGVSEADCRQQIDEWIEENE